MHLHVKILLHFPTWCINDLALFIHQTYHCLFYSPNLPWLPSFKQLVFDFASNQPVPHQVHPRCWLTLGHYTERMNPLLQVLLLISSTAPYHKQAPHLHLRDLLPFGSMLLLVPFPYCDVDLFGSPGIPLSLCISPFLAPGTLVPVLTDGKNLCQKCIKLSMFQLYAGGRGERGMGCWACSLGGAEGRSLTCSRDSKILAAAVVEWPALCGCCCCCYSSGCC